MIFTLTITDPKTELIFSDLFIMDDESEVLSKLKFLVKKEDYAETKKGYSLEIKTLKNTVIEVSTDSITRIQILKTRIYDVLIEKGKEENLYCSPEFK